MSDDKMKHVRLKYNVIGTLGVPPNGKLIYSLLLDSADEKGNVQVSMREMARRLGIGKKAVSANIHLLEENGCIGILPQYYPDGGRTSNRYTVR